MTAIFAIMPPRSAELAPGLGLIAQCRWISRANQVTRRRSHGPVLPVSQRWLLLWHAEKYVQPCKMRRHVVEEGPATVNFVALAEVTEVVWSSKSGDERNLEPEEAAQRALLLQNRGMALHLVDNPTVSMKLGEFHLIVQNDVVLKVDESGFGNHCTSMLNALDGDLQAVLLNGLGILNDGRMEKLGEFVGRGPDVRVVRVSKSLGDRFLRKPGLPVIVVTCVTFSTFPR